MASCELIETLVPVNPIAHVSNCKSVPAIYLYIVKRKTLTNPAPSAWASSLPRRSSCSARTSRGASRRSRCARRASQTSFAARHRTWTAPPTKGSGVSSCPRPRRGTGSPASRRTIPLASRGGRARARARVKAASKGQG